MTFPRTINTVASAAVNATSIQRMIHTAVIGELWSCVHSHPEL